MQWPTAKAILYVCVVVWGLAAIAGGVTSESELAIQQLGARSCPAGTTPDHTTYQQSVRDSSGFTSQDTVWILQCKDANGTVVEENSNYFLPWLGLFVGAAVLLTLPVMIGVVIALIVGRNKNRKPAVQPNIFR
jgi:hypothetical protein